MAVPPRTHEPELFTTVRRNPTLSDTVAGSIADAVMSGRLKPGEELHSERDLAEQFGVSRTVIREAIRSLAAQGLVESHSGRRIQVTSAGPDGVNRSMSLFLRSNATIDYPKIHEVRSALEIRMAATAAERASDDDLAKLRTLQEQMAVAHDDPERAAQLDLDFHGAIAAATGNELFAVVLGSIGEVLLETRRSAFAAPGMLDYALAAHGQILDCLERRDPRGASEAMLAHLDRAARVWSGADTPAA
jgi:GntR family transcriptional repressor for pyruvate dehydrogenase complex